MVLCARCAERHFRLDEKTLVQAELSDLQRGAGKGGEG
jgi:hypothetical protein